MTGAPAEPPHGPAQELPPPPPAGALELATLLSVATRIEPELIRAVRLRLLPHLDVGAEADLWFCDWVGARTHEAVALLPACLPYLRAGLVDRLATDPRLKDVFAIVSAFHHDLSPALVLEEQVTWHSLMGEQEAADRELGRVLHALVRQNRSGLAGWFADAWDRLPAESRATATAWQLANATRSHVPFPAPGAVPHLGLGDVASIATAVGEARLGVRRVGRTVFLGEVRGAGAAAFLVPDTRPRVVEVLTDGERRTVQIDPGSVVQVGVGAGPVRLRTGAGHVYEIHRPVPAPAPTPGEPEVPAWEVLHRLLDAGAGPELVPRLTEALRELVDRFRREDDDATLLEAHRLAVHVLDAGYEPERHPGLGCAAASALGLHGVHLGVRKSLARAADTSRRVVSASSAGESTEAVIVRASVHRALFSLTGGLGDLQVALDAFASFPPGRTIPSRLRSEMLHTCLTLHALDRRQGDLERALSIAGDAPGPEGGPDDDQVLAPALARLHLARYQATGDVGALQHAEILAERIEQASRAARAERLAVLAGISLAWFRHDGGRDALAAAVTHLRSALALTPRSRVRHTELQTELGDALRVRFRLLRDEEDLREAGALLQRASESTHRRSLWRLNALDGLSRCRLDSFRLTGSSADLDSAIKASRAVGDHLRTYRDIPRAHRARGRLVEALIARYRAAGDATALGEARTLTRSTTAILSSSFPAALTMDANSFASVVLESQGRRPLEKDLRAAFDRLNSLGRVPDGPLKWQARLLRAAVAARLADVPSAVLHDVVGDMRSIAQRRDAPPLQRVKAAVLWGKLALRLGSPAEIRISYRLVTQELPPLLLLPAGELTDREHLMRAWEAHAREAAAASIEIGAPERALEFLEQRGALLSSWYRDSHAEVDRLTGAAPDLAAELKRLWGVLTLDDGPADLPVFARPDSVQTQLDHLIHSLRAVPGFEDFLAPVPARRVIQAAREGPVVVLNAAARRCDALLVSPHGISAVPLPEVTLETLTERVARYGQVTPALPYRDIRIPSGPDTFPGLLAWLWDSTVQPVMAALGLLGPDRTVAADPAPRSMPPDETLPRVWWCPTGPFTRLPLHAAGHQRESAMDHAVSSYVPSLQALLLSRRQERRSLDRSAQRVLLVASPRSPGHPPLPHAEREVDVIRRLLPAVTVLDGTAATVDRVLGELSGHPFFHFAGHASHEDGIPRLHLGEEGLTPSHLTHGLAGHGALAYLSACGTADGDRTDEGGSWTLASTFQSAGYCHVIAMLGAVEDVVAAEVAISVYRFMTDDDGRLRPERSARALHRALQRLRLETRGFLPVGIVHLGP